MSGLDDLTSAVSAAETVVDSAITFIGGLRDKLTAAMSHDGLDSDSAVGQLASELSAKTNDLSAAIVENTDSDEQPAEVQAADQTSVGDTGAGSTDSSTTQTS